MPPRRPSVVRQRPQRALPGLLDPRTPTRKRQGLTQVQVEAVRVEQQQCALCQKPLGSDFMVDHCHACATAHGHDPRVGCPQCFRALLCRPCNSALGWFEKRPDRVVAYSSHGRHG